MPLTDNNGQPITPGQAQPPSPDVRQKIVNYQPGAAMDLDTATVLAGLPPPIIAQLRGSSLADGVKLRDQAQQTRMGLLSDQLAGQTPPAPGGAPPPLPWQRRPMPPVGQAGAQPAPAAAPPSLPPRAPLPASLALPSSVPEAKTGFSPGGAPQPELPQGPPQLTSPPSGGRKQNWLSRLGSGLEQALPEIVLGIGAATGNRGVLAAEGGYLRGQAQGEQFRQRQMMLLAQRQQEADFRQAEIDARSASTKAQSDRAAAQLAETKRLHDAEIKHLETPKATPGAKPLTPAQALDMENKAITTAGLLPASEQPGYVAGANAQLTKAGATPITVPGSATGTRPLNYGLKDPAQAAQINGPIGDAISTAIAMGTGGMVNLPPGLVQPQAVTTAPYYGPDAKSGSVIDRNKATGGAASTRASDYVRHNQATETETHDFHQGTLGETTRNHDLQHGDRLHGQAVGSQDRVRGQDMAHGDRLRGQDMRGAGGAGKSADPLGAIDKEIAAQEKPGKGTRDLTPGPTFGKMIPGPAPKDASSAAQNYYRHLLNRRKQILNQQSSGVPYVVPGMSPHYSVVDADGVGTASVPSVPRLPGFAPLPQGQTPRPPAAPRPPGSRKAALRRLDSLLGGK